MAGHSLLADLVITYAIALGLVVVLARARVPSIVAFILAGVVAGPHVTRLISTPEEVEQLAEIGIVLLLFTVGLDFSLAAVRQIWRRVVAAGALQIAGTAAVVGAVLVLAGHLSPSLALFIGLFVALSSTAIVLKGLAERNELASPSGRLTVGVLLLQDLAIVVLLLLVPILSGRTPLAAVPVAAGRALLAVAVVAGGSRLLLPALLRLVTASRRREAFPLAIIVASIGTAWLSSLLGLSMAIGAFLAGLTLAESEFSHQAYAEVRPLRDVLSGLFFISLGMLVDVPTLLAHLPEVLAVAAAIIVAKALVAAGALTAAMSPLRVAVASALGLAQVGEFSFILGRAGLDAGLLPASTWQTMLGASIATMVATPSLLAAAPAVASWVRAGQGGRAPARAAGGVPPLSGHIVVLGFGVGGQLVARAIRQLGISYLVLELNGATVRTARAKGERIFYGDATSPDSLRAAHIESAMAVVSLLSDPDAARRMVQTVRGISPSIPIVVRTRYRGEAERLEALGATAAVAEELEASLEVVAQLLSRLHVAGNTIEAMLDVFRHESVSLRPGRAPAGMLGSLPEPLRQMPVSSHRLEPGQWGVGRTLAELNLRAQAGVSILAIQREDRYITPPDPDEGLQSGDVLYLTGGTREVTRARRRLQEGA